jgi:ankyrin repeat protein
MLTLVTTICVVLGIHSLLVGAIGVFILCLDAMALALIATSWLAFDKSAAIVCTVMLSTLAAMIFIITAVPGGIWSWYMIFQSGKTYTVEASPSVRSRKIGLMNGINLRKMSVALGGSLYKGDGDNEDGNEHDDDQPAHMFSKDFGKMRFETKAHEILMVAVAEDNWRHRVLLLLLLAQGADPDERSSAGYTPLSLAVIRENEWAVQKLIEEGAEVLLNQSDMATLAIWSGKKADALIKEHCIDLSGSLFAAIKTKNSSRLRDLLRDTNTRINSRESMSGDTSLHFAVKRGWLYGVEELLEADVRVDLRNQKGLTALHLSIIYYCFTVASGAGICVLVDEDTASKKNDCETIIEGDEGDDAATLLSSVNGTESRRTKTTDQDDVSIREIIALKLIRSIMNKNKKLLNLVIGKRANTSQDFKNLQSFSALHVAVYFHANNLVSELLQCGSDFNKVTDGNETACHIAVRKKNLDALRSLLATDGIKLNHVDNSDETPLIAAVKTNYMAGIAEMIKHPTRIDFNKAKSIGITPLHLACELGDRRMVELLLAVEGIDYNNHSLSGRTPLHLAAEANAPDAVEALLCKCSLKINELDSEGYTPLHLAAQRGHFGVVEKLLADTRLKINTRAGARPTALDVADFSPSIAELLRKHGAKHQRELEDEERMRDSHGPTDLHEACAENNLDRVRILLAEGAIDINTRDHSSGQKQTPLHIAARLNDPGILDELLKVQYGAVINCEDADDWTPLHHACDAGNEQAVKTLLACGGDVHNDTIDGEMPLHIFAKSQNCNNLNIVKMLVEKGADVDKGIHGRFGLTALHLAAEKGDASLIRFLAKMGADLDKPDNRQYRALHFACFAGHLEAVRALLDNGSNPNVVNDDSQTPLTAVAVCQNPDDDEIVGRLLEDPRTDINQRGPKDQTILHIACDNGNERLLETLLKLPNINVCAEDQEEQTALHVATAKIQPASPPSMAKVYYNCIELLLKANNKIINKRDRTGKTALDLAMTMKVRKLLTQHGGKESKDILETRAFDSMV